MTPQIKHWLTFSYLVIIRVGKTELHASSVVLVHLVAVQD